MDDLIKNLLLNSPGWAVAVYLIWRDLKHSDDRVIRYEKLSDAYHSCIVESTKVIERLTTIIEERTRRQDER